MTTRNWESSIPVYTPKWESTVPSILNSFSTPVTPTYPIKVQKRYKSPHGPYANRESLTPTYTDFVPVAKNVGVNDSLWGGRWGVIDSQL